MIFPILTAFIFNVLTKVMQVVHHKFFLPCIVYVHLPFLLPIDIYTASQKTINIIGRYKLRFPDK